MQRLDFRLMQLAGAASVSVATALVGLKGWAWGATGSVALLSSLADSVLDLFASLVTFMALRVAAAPADREHRFGHGKSEAIAGLAQSLLITASAFYVGYQAVRRLLEPAQIMAPRIGVGVMVVSLGLTIALVVFQRFVIRKTRSLAIGADALHYEADILTNLAVLFAIGGNYWLGWYATDPILGLVVVGLILASVRKIAVVALDVLLDRELPGEARGSIREIATEHPDVRGVHDIRTRSSGVAEFIQLHLELDPQLTLSAAHRISDQVEQAIKRRFPRAEIIIHADPVGINEPRDSF